MKIVNLSTDEGLMIVDVTKEVKETWLVKALTICKNDKYVNISNDEVKMLEDQLTDRVKFLAENDYASGEIQEFLEKDGQEHNVDGWAYRLDTEEELNEILHDGEMKIVVSVVKEVEIDTVISFSLAPMLEKDYEKNSDEIDEYLDTAELSEEEFNMVKICLENNGTSGEAELKNGQYGAKYSWKVLTE